MSDFHQRFGRQLTEFEDLLHKLNNRYLDKNDVASFKELLAGFEDSYPDLFRNDKKSLILLQRLQRAIGEMIHAAPNWLFSQKLLERCVNLSPDPLQLAYAVEVGVKNLLSGKNGEKALLSLGLEAARLGGVTGRAITISEAKYGRDEGYSDFFVPWKNPTVKQQQMGMVATKLFTTLFANTLEYSYLLDPRDVDNNLFQFMCGLAFYGGEPGCREMMALIPAYTEKMIAKGTFRDVDKVLDLDSAQQTSFILKKLFDATNSTNVLHVFREHSYQDFAEYCATWDVRYSAQNSIKGGSSYFDVSALALEIDEVRQDVISSVNQCFNGSDELDLARGKELVKILSMAGLRGSEMRNAVVNSHVSNITQFVLDACLSLIDGKNIDQIPPRDSIAQVVDFGLNGGKKYDEFMLEHRECCDSMIEFLKECSAKVTKNALVTGLVLKDPSIKDVLNSSEAMRFIAAASIYWYGTDSGMSVGSNREYLSELEVAALAGYLARHYEKENPRAWDFDLSKEFRAELPKRALHPESRLAMGILSEQQVSQFKEMFNGWFTQEYASSIVSRHQRALSKRLESELGM
ncbi:hypothetical protein [Pseudomonas putida]|uniref:Uncharacterized protein n=1 Tax=Pseudomonas putida TaxID=303 RepID=A0A8I1EBQ6_PSEPU|nr:hypothetical protein [Pseudomonas putida]MBI6882875.1 hypothetical protein [Pseudomonas putida]